MRIVSNCCKAPRHRYYDEICSSCGEHCELIDEYDGEPIETKERVGLPYSAAQMKEIMDQIPTEL